MEKFIYDLSVPGRRGVDLPASDGPEAPMPAELCVPWSPSDPDRARYDERGGLPDRRLPDEVKASRFCRGKKQ